MDSRKWKIGKNMLVIEDDDTWDHFVDTQQNESFLSWYSRLAKANAADPKNLLKYLIKDKIDDIREIEMKDSLKKRILSRIQNFNSNQVPGDFWTKSTLLSSEENYLFGLDKMTKFCRLCLYEDIIPYFRIIWQFKSVYICTNHNTVLDNKCPFCLRDVRYWKTTLSDGLNVCWNCKRDISTNTWINPSKVSQKVNRFQQGIIDFYEQRQNKLISTLTNTEGFCKSFQIALFRQLDLKEDTFLTKSTFQERLEILTNLFIEIESNPKKILEGFYCKKCDNSFTSQAEFDRDTCQMGSKLLKIRGLYEKQLGERKTPDDVVNFRFEVVTTLITQGTTAQSVKKLASQLDIGASTIWRWIKKYREYNSKDSLRNEYGKRGRKSKYAKEIFESYYQEFNRYYGEVAMTRIYDNQTKKLRSEIGPTVLLPSFSNARRYFYKHKDLRN